MAKHEIVMPQMGESITNGTITKWNKSKGDLIDIDEILLEISTDKVESEIPSPYKGRIADLKYAEGDVVDVGLVIAFIEDDLSAAVEETSVGTPAAKNVAAVPELPSVGTPAVSIVAEAVATASEGKSFFTPLVKAMAKDKGIALTELDKIKGTGHGGRVNKADLINYIENSKGASAAMTSAAPTAAATAITVGTDRVEVIPMDSMRKTIARNMVESKRISPHVNSVSEVDLSRLVKFRESFKGEFLKNEGFKLTYTPFIMKALIDALKEHPYINASIDGDNVLLKKDINLGFAVSVNGKGLVVPVLKNADTLNMTGICRGVNDLAHKARAKKLKMDELQGGTFTFSNVGSFGTMFATPIILRPQVGIYAAGAIAKRVVVVEDDAIAVRPMMYGTHTYDHRLIDGALGGLFLETVHENLRTMAFDKLF